MLEVVSYYLTQDDENAEYKFVNICEQSRQNFFNGRSSYKMLPTGLNYIAWLAELSCLGWSSKPDNFATAHFTG